MEEQSAPQPTITQPASSPAPVKQSIKPLIIVVGLVFLLMTGGLVYFGYQNYQLQQKLNQLQEQQTSQIQSSPSSLPASQTAMSGKLYTDPFSAFTFNYPDNFVVQGGIYQGQYYNKELLITLQVAGTESYRPTNQLSVVTRKTSGLDTFLDDFYSLKVGEIWSTPNFAPKYTRIADSVIGGITVHNYSQSGDSEGEDRMTILNKNGKYYVLTYGSENPGNLQPDSPEYGVDFAKAFNQVFSSFRFL